MATGAQSIGVDGDGTVERPRGGGYTPPVLPTPWILLAACAEWPRFSHLPEASSAVEVGAETVDTGEGTSIQWVELPPRTDDHTDDSPLGLPAESLSSGRGNWVQTTLLGSGRDPKALPARDQACGHVSAFPPDEAGDYLGDVDWRVVDLVEAGTFCSVLELADPEARADVLLYTLDECGVPVVANRAGDGSLLGWDIEDATVRWHWPIIEPVRMGVVVAGRLPDDPEALLVYDWSLSLLPPPEEGSTAPVTCPTHEDGSR